MKRQIFPVQVQKSVIGNQDQASSNIQSNVKLAPKQPQEIIICQILKNKLGFYLETIHQIDDQQIPIAKQKLEDTSDIDFQLIELQIHKLFISKCRLQTVEISQFSSLISLDLSFNSLTELPLLPYSLLNLNIKSNNIININLQNTKLNQLDISQMYPVITTLPSTLKTLILSNFQLNITDISFLSNLESLSLNQLDINSQKRLQDVCKEKISIYKYNEVQFESNFKLNLFHNPTEKQCKFPQNLLKITAKNCQIIDFKLGSLQKLQELIIDSNTIYCDDLELPKCLLSLSINSCNIDSFDFRKLNLIEINASNNVCKTCLVPTNIQKLNLSGNIFLKQLNFPLFNLTHLNLENCTKLYIQTEQIGKNINFLNLSKTRIRHIDINIYTNLQTCILRNNSLDYMFVYKKRKSKIDVSGTEFRLTPIIINSSLSGHSAENSVKFPINCRRLLQNHEILRNDSAIARRAELVVKITDLQNKLQALIDQ